MAGPVLTRNGEMALIGTSIVWNGWNYRKTKSTNVVSPGNAATLRNTKKELNIQRANRKALTLISDM